MHTVLHLDADASFNTAGNPGETAGLIAAYAVAYLLLALVYSRVFKKAGYPGWLAIVPIVNSIVIVKIAGHTAWSALLFLIPGVGFVWSIIVANHLGRNFGKGGAFSFFLLVWPLPFIGYLILAFGKSAYSNGKAALVA